MRDDTISKVEPFYADQTTGHYRLAANKDGSIQDLAHMLTKLNDKSAWILIIEPSQGRRSMLSSGIKDLRIGRVTTSASVKEALDQLETEESGPDWILTTLQEHSAVNAIHLLSILLSQTKLNATRVSLILDENQEFCVPGAMAMGLLSYHRKAPDIMNQLTGIAELLEWENECKGDECLVAARYLRRYLRSQKKYDTLFPFEKSLLSLYPSHEEVTIAYAETLYLQGKPRLAGQVIAQVKPKSLSGHPVAAELIKTLKDLETSENSCVTPSFSETWNINTCVVIDPDDAVRIQLSDCLTQLGVTTIHAFGDGLSAWEWLKSNKEPDLIVQEWRLPNLSADILVQRIRQKGLRSVPIILFSSLVKNTDRILLREVGVSDVIEKPQPNMQLAMALIEIVKEERKPEKELAVERRLRQALQLRDFSTARELFDQVSRSKTTHPATLRAFEAEFAFCEEKLQLASEKAIEALHLRGEDVTIMNLLGKIYHRMGMHEQASRFFKSANQLSPHNIERLCALAETSISAKDLKGAEIALKEAQEIDETSELVVDTETKIAVASHQHDRAKDLISKNKNIGQVISFLNNQAVALTKDSKFEESIKLYLSALESMPREYNYLKPIIQYNLGLAYVRIDDVKSAYLYLKQASRSATNDLKAKIDSLNARVEHAVVKGGKVTLRTASPEESSHEEEIIQLPYGIPYVSQIKRGKFRVYLIFRPTDDHQPEFQKLLKDRPRFRDRVSSISYTKKSK